MRLTYAGICLAITLAGSGASAQVPPLPGSPAPVGHRQPSARDLPPDVANVTVHREGRKAEVPLGGPHQILDARIIRSACEELGLNWSELPDRRVGCETREKVHNRRRRGCRGPASSIVEEGS